MVQKNNAGDLSIVANLTSRCLTLEVENRQLREINHNLDCACVRHRHALADAEKVAERANEQMRLTLTANGGESMKRFVYWWEQMYFHLRNLPASLNGGIDDDLDAGPQVMGWIEHLRDLAEAADVAEGSALVEFQAPLGRHVVLDRESGEVKMFRESADGGWCGLETVGSMIGVDTVPNGQMPEPRPGPHDLAAAMGLNGGTPAASRARETAADLAPAGGDGSIPGTIRRFDSGATRDTDHGKPDYEGFLSPAVVEAFGDYMQQHRRLPDGSIRDSDNWQQGIPKDVYIKSAFRHFVDWWLAHRGQHSREGTRNALCGLLFNVQGYLHEHLKDRGNVIVGTTFNKAA